MSETPARRGRPRSEEATKAILDAALGIALKDGYGALTMEGIAVGAGVGKQTVSRWWPSRGAVVLDAIRTLADRIIPLCDHGSLRGDLRAFLAATFGAPRRIRPVLAGLMAEAQLDPKLHEALYRRLIEPRRAALLELLERARGRGEIRPGFELALGVDLAFGVLWYRLLVGHAPLDDRAADALADAIARAAAP